MQKKLRWMLKKFWQAAVMVVLLCVFFMMTGCGGSEDPAALPTNKTVNTVFGAVQGATAEEVWVWKGIPYAKAPVGNLRWKAPVDPDAWTGVRQATVACSECVQQVYTATWFSANAFIGDEDCLYLDIYAPRTVAANLPVYFYIHGGSNNFGSAKQYNGAELAKRGNMIVVYVQYRLNAMGFLTHPSLRTGGDPLDDSGNYGILDIQKALEWVQNNIAAFGGDATKVAIGGQSAGAHNIMNLLTSPRPANFRAAFAQSVAGPDLMNLKTIAESDTWTNTTIDGLLIRGGFAANAAAAAALRTGMSNTQIENFLRSQPAELIARCRRDGVGADGSGNMGTHSAIRDGNVVRNASWVESIAAGNYHKVPVVNGGTRYEWRNFAPLYGTVVKTYTGGLVPSGVNSWLQLWNVIGILPPAMTADDVLPLQADKDLYATLTDLRSQMWRLNGVDNINRALKADDPTNPVYGFVFKWAGGGDPARADFAAYFGAGHGMDIPFFQGGSADAWNYSFTAANQTGRIALQGATMDYLIAFVKTMNPNPAGSSLPTWPQWDTTAGGPKVMTFDATLTNYLLAVDTEEIITDDLNADIAAAKVSHPYPMAWMVNGL
jgi:para-nitrobenzyl esterase